LHRDILTVVDHTFVQTCILRRAAANTRCNSAAQNTVRSKCLSLSP